ATVIAFAAAACGRVAFEPLCTAQDIMTDALDPARWTINNAASPIPVSYSNGELDVTLPAPPVTGNNGITTHDAYDLTVGYAEVVLLGGDTWIDPASGYDVALVISLDPGDYYALGVDGSDLFFAVHTNGTNDEAGLFPAFDPIAHAHWRIRKDNTEV